LGWLTTTDQKGGHDGICDYGIAALLRNFGFDSGNDCEAKGSKFLLLVDIWFHSFCFGAVDRLGYPGKLRSVRCAC
jgi:hypothetical protein